MTLLTKEEADSVEQAIRDVERETDAELVAVLAHQADDYHYIPTLWAALLALLVPGGISLTPYWLNLIEVMLVQLVVFLVLAVLLRMPPVLRHIIPRKVRAWRAQNLARRMFLEAELHHTTHESGVLIFVSETERMVEIIADRGVSARIGDEHWQQIVNEFTGLVKQGKTQQGFLTAIKHAGDLLKTHLPATTDQDELPNRLILI